MKRPKKTLDQPKTPMALRRLSLRAPWCLMFLFLSAAGLGWGQSVALSGIAHVAFHVPDIAKTSDFYQRLGFEQAFAFSKDGKTVQAFIKINDLQFIELYPLTRKDPQAGFMHLCFEGSDLVQLHAAYQLRGLTPTEVRKAHAGNLLFTMVGPENQNIEYTQYLPGSLHSGDRSKHLGKDRLSEHLKTVAVNMQDTAAAEAFYIDKLSFQPASSNDRSDLLLPGPSGESVLLRSSDNRALPDLIFQIHSIRRTAKDLKKRGFALRVTGEGVYVTDPDGTLIEFSSKPRE
jgi:catechol 2,3-dioxygenase-like lactoylglutathione lyase family enzyme